MAESATVTVRLDPKMKERLDALAKDTKRSKSFLAAEAIDAYLESQAWQIDHVKVGLAELDAGESIPHDKVLRWVESWGTPDELPAPECD